MNEKEMIDINNVISIANQLCNTKIMSSKLQELDTLKVELNKFQEQLSNEEDIDNEIFCSLILKIKKLNADITTLIDKNEKEMKNVKQKIKNVNQKKEENISQEIKYSNNNNNSNSSTLSTLSSTSTNVEQKTPEKTPEKTQEKIMKEMEAEQSNIDKLILINELINNERKNKKSNESNESNASNEKIIKIVTWNVNGIRSRVFNDKVGIKSPKKKIIKPEENSPMQNLLNETDADIICLQETRCDIQNGSCMVIPGYYGIFNHSNLSGSRGCNRYSGTAIYTKEIPKQIQISVPNYEDDEGRIIIFQYEKFIVVNVYSPNSGTNYNNKILFQNALLEYINTFIKNENGNNIEIFPVIYCGDFNMAIDTHFDKSKFPVGPGLYKHELEYYDILKQNGFVDTISKKDKIVYTWWDQRAKKIINPETNREINSIRYNNRGWRLDYIFTRCFKSGSSKVLKHIGEEHSPHGSDHAPVFGILKL